MIFFSWLKAIFKVGDLRKYTPLQVVFIRTVNSILNLGILATFFSGLVHIVDGQPEIVIHNWGLAILFSLPKVLLKRGLIWLASLLFILIINSALYFYTVVSGPSLGFQNFLLVTTVMPFIMGVDRKTFSLSLLSIACALVLYYTDYHNPFNIVLQKTHWNQFHTYLLLTFTVSILVLILQKSHIDKKKASDEEQLNSFNTSRLASLAELSGSIAHELNNPLAILTGKLEILQSHFEADKLTNEKLGKELKNLRKSADRMTAIIASMTEMLTGSSEVSLYNFVGTVTHAISLAKHMNHQVQINLEKHCGDIWVEGSSSQMTQAILNLIVNGMEAASKATPPAWVKIILDADDFMVSLQIVDSGAGVSKEIASKIFDPFFSTKPPNKGVGLGLPIALRIVEAQDGKLLKKVDSQHTTFSITLPRVPPSALVKAL